MQSVHVTAYMIRDLRGNYVRTGRDEGIGYVMYRTKSLAKACIEQHYPEGAFVVKVRTAITPIDSGRAERMVAVQQARPKTISEKLKNNFFPF